MTLQERLRDREPCYPNRPLELEAADALDAQEKRIRELEGALREWLDAEDRPSGVWATDLRRVNDIMKRARAALKDAGAS